MYRQTGTDQQESAVASRAAPARRWEPQTPVMETEATAMESTVAEETAMDATVTEEASTVAPVTEETATGATAAVESAAPVATSQAGRHRRPPWPARPP
jgi:hypothetical protein